MKRLFLLFLFVILLFPVFSQTIVDYTPDQLKQDFGIFRQALIEAHPGLYRYQSMKEVESQFASIEKQLDKSITEEQFYRLLNPIVANIGCGHTKFHRKGNPDDHFAFHRERLFPLLLYFQSDGRAYVRNNVTDNKIIEAGSEIKAINGRPIGDIIKHLFKQIYADGSIASSKYQELNQFFAGYYANFIGTSDSFVVDYKTKTNKKLHCTLKAVSYSQLTINSKQTSNVNPFHLTFPEAKVALIKIDVFASSEDQFKNFLSVSFKEIRDKNIKHLILDLRDNEGGIDPFGAWLYAWLTTNPFHYYDHLKVVSIPPYSFAQYATLPKGLDEVKDYIKKQGNEYVFTDHPNLGIQQPTDTPYSGKLYILENGSSFSVTSEFAAIVRDNKRGVFIGEESGGAISGNNSGAFAKVQLPNTHLNLDIPLVGYYVFLGNSFQKDRGIIPEYPVRVTIADVLEKRDPVMQKALQLIHE